MKPLIGLLVVVHEIYLGKRRQCTNPFLLITSFFGSSLSSSIVSTLSRRIFFSSIGSNGADFDFLELNF